MGGSEPGDTATEDDDVLGLSHFELAFGDDHRLPHPIVKRQPAQAKGVHRFRDDPPERPEIRRGALGHVAELERLDVLAEDERLEVGSPQELPHGVGNKIVKMYGEEKRPSRSEQTRRATPVVRVRQCQDAVFRQQLVSTLEHRFRIGRVLQNVPRGEKVDASLLERGIEERSLVKR